MIMEHKLEELKKDALQAIKAAKDKLHLEEVANKLLGRKQGELTILLKGLKDLSDEMRKSAGQLANEVKQTIEEAINVKRNTFEAEEMKTRLVEEKNRHQRASFAKKDPRSLASEHYRPA